MFSKRRLSVNSPVQNLWERKLRSGRRGGGELGALASDTKYSSRERKPSSTLAKSTIASEPR
jgi:hypothetical protein